MPAHQIEIGDRVEITSAGEYTGTIGHVRNIRNGLSKTNKPRLEYQVDLIGWFPVVFACPDENTIQKRAEFYKQQREAKKEAAAK